MLLLAKAFLDIAFGRKGPAHLPASPLLLALVSAAAAALEALDASLSAEPIAGIWARLVLAVGLPLVFTWALLSLARRKQRILQTNIALMGVGVLAAIVLYPLGALYKIVGAERVLSYPIGFLVCVGFLWYMLVCAQIWRAALDSGLLLGGVISVGYLILTLALQNQLLPQT
jgi:hypothetical protein